MAMIKIKSGKQVISIESDNAGVPDVTQDAGPDVMKLQDDAKAEPNETNAEFDAAKDASPVESEDKTQDVDKANESFFDVLFGTKKVVKGAERSNESLLAGILSLESEDAEGGDEPTPETSDTTPVADAPAEETPAAEEPAAEEPAPEETPAEEPAGEDGAGDVSESDGTTTVDTGDVVITITNSEKSEGDEPAAEEPGSDAPAAEEPAAEGAESCGGKSCGGKKAKEEAPAAPTANAAQDNAVESASAIDKALESFFGL